jgi:pectate lyase
MKNIGICIFCSVVLFGVSNGLAQPAFPGAEGYGAVSVGGRGGQVIKVTNLNDSGPGSLRKAIETSGPRIIVFEVSGNIMLQSRLTINRPYVTIAGQTAPGDGVAVVGEQVNVETHDVIIRYLRFRATDLKQKELDALTDDSGQYNVIIDHCTVSWGIDETLSFYRGHDFTIQWCMITESLYNSCHSKGPHGYGGIWGGTRASFHHNLLAHHSSRTPRFARDCYMDHRNNVIYNWGFNSAYGGERSSINIINNYYKYGPATRSGSVRYRIYQCSDTDAKAYVAGNYVEGYRSVTIDNWSGGVQYSSGASQATLRVHSPFQAADVNTTSAEQAYIDVIADVGASYPCWDAIDSRIINEVQTRTAAYGSSFNGGGNGIIDSQYDLCPNGGLTAGGAECSDGDNDYCWLPVLNSTEPPTDSDDDGMPDDWELAHCLDPCDPGDANGDRNGDGYTNIEEYINWIPLREPMPMRHKTDLNCDDTVNFDDFSEFAKRYCSSSGTTLYEAKYDFNNDDVILVKDLLYIAQDWLWFRLD